MSKKKYWQSFGELNQTASFQEASKNEFQEELLPLADLDDKGILDAKTPRRDFLKYLGFYKLYSLNISCTILTKTEL